MADKENKIQLAILRYLRSNDYYCWRNANTQRFIAGKYINNPYHISGLPDIICILEGGKYLGIETKTETGRQSVVQAMHERRIKSLGGYYLLARSLNDVKSFLAEISTD